MSEVLRRLRGNSGTKVWTLEGYQPDKSYQEVIRRRFELKFSILAIVIVRKESLRRLQLIGIHLIIIIGLRRLFMSDRPQR